MISWSRTRLSTSALNSEAMTPMDSVTPKPLTGPTASQNSSPAASRVVAFESATALNAPRNPRSTERGIRRRRANSSRARSNTSTFASTAMPTASTNPARPGRVRVAPIARSAA